MSGKLIPRGETQIEQIRHVLESAAKAESWLTLKELARMTGFGEASISAQIRNLRKSRYGSCRIERKWNAACGWEYCMNIHKDTQTLDARA